MSCVHGERTTCPLLFSIAYGMTGSVSDAEDIVQEAFGRLAQALRRGTQVSEPKAYLATTATRLAAWSTRISCVASAGCPN